MKSVFTSLLLVFPFVMGICQSPIIINAPDMPVPTTSFNYDDITDKKPAVPTLGSNQSWNYSTYFSNKTVTSQYFKEEDPFYVNLGVDVYTTGFKNLNQQLGFNLFTEIDFNNNGIDDVGIYVDSQTYSLEALTGNSTDNITFPAQGYVFQNPRRIVKFPMTANSSWESQSKRLTDFTIKVAAYGLNNVPARIVYNTIRKDTIVGWGTLRVHTPTGPSIPYDVLINKSQQYNIDSFYLNGTPAPALLLNAFSITQGQRTGYTNAYNFYRAGTFSYLLRLNYGPDETYKNLESAFYNTDNLSGISSVNNTLENAYTTILFPNPTGNNVINLIISGKDVPHVHYTVSDMSGRIIKKVENQKLQSNQFSVVLDEQITSGMYFIEVMDRDQRIITKESFIVKN